MSAAAERGGLESILLNILKSLDPARYTAEVVLLEDGPLVAEIRETGTEAHVINAGRVRQLTRGAIAVAKISQLIRQRQIDLVHCHNAKAHIYGGLAAKITGIPSVYHLHGVPRPTVSRDGLVSLLSVLTPASKIVACSHYVATTFSAAWRTKRAVSVIHNGIMPASSSTLKDGLVRQECGIATGSPMILLASRLQHGKGVHIFLQSAALVARQYPHARFVVVGGSLFGLEKDYSDTLRLQADRLGLGSSVVFTGHRIDVARFFAAADLVVHSSIQPDSFPTVLLEAMAWGKPVVATDLGGPKEIVQHGVTGFLVPPGRADLQSTALLTLLSDAALRERMGVAATARFHDEFLATRMTRQFEAIYEDAVGGNRA